MAYTAYIGLGSNLDSTAGTPAETVRAAVRALGGLGTVSAFSSLYSTAPVGVREQPYFINAVARLETELGPERLLREMLAVERTFGRERRKSEPKGPRTLDLDLLLMFAEDGSAVLTDLPGLKLPHPEMATRRFVLTPLAEIDARLRHPVLGKTILELISEENSSDEVVRLEAPRQ